MNTAIARTTRVLQ